jgi:hypothetical protein
VAGTSSSARLSADHFLTFPEPLNVGLMKATRVNRPSTPRSIAPGQHLVKVRLSDREYRALVRHAIGEDRPLQLQATRLIREGLDAAGAFGSGEPER